MHFQESQLRLLEVRPETLSQINKTVSCMGARGVPAGTMHFQESQLRLLEVRPEPLSQINKTVSCMGARGVPAGTMHFQITSDCFLSCA